MQVIPVDEDMLVTDRPVFIGVLLNIAARGSITLSTLK
jgi:hypothetical protein